jgi:hypothetical protein
MRVLWIDVLAEHGLRRTPGAPGRPIGVGGVHRWSETSVTPLRSDAIDRLE